jgi:hypothetical protein
LRDFPHTLGGTDDIHATGSEQDTGQTREVESLDHPDRLKLGLFRRRGKAMVEAPITAFEMIGDPRCGWRV